MKSTNLILLFLLFAGTIFGQSLSNEVAGISQNVVVTSSANPSYTIEMNFVSREGWNAQSVIDSVAGGEIEYIVEFIDEHFVFSVTSASTAVSGKLILGLTLQTPSGTLFLFPTANGTIQQRTTNYSFKMIDAASSEDDKTNIANDNWRKLDTLLTVTSSIEDSLTYADDTLKHYNNQGNVQEIAHIGRDSFYVLEDGVYIQKVHLDTLPEGSLDSFVLVREGLDTTTIAHLDTIKVPQGPIYQLLDSDQVSLLGTDGITAVRATGVLTITVPDGGVLTKLMMVKFDSGDGVFAGGSMTNALKIEIVHTDGTTYWASSPTVLQWNAGDVVNAGNSPDKMFGTSDEDWEMHDLAAGLTSYVINEVSTRTSPDGGFVSF